MSGISSEVEKQTPGHLGRKERAKGPPLPSEGPRRLYPFLTMQDTNNRLLPVLETVYGIVDTSTTNDEVQPSEWVPFPTEVLPRPAQDYVRAAAAAMPCNEALVAVPVVAVMAAAVGNSCRIRLKNSWTEHAAIWAAIVAPSGSSKSPALDVALRPVYALEREARQDHSEAQKRHLETSTVGTTRRTKDASMETSLPRRYRTGDATTEALAALHARNPRGLLIARDELAGWLGSMDRYARGESDLQTWIEMHSGRPVTIDRKVGEPPSIFLDSPCVSIVGTFQPGTLGRKLSATHFESGFAARLLLAMPPTPPKKWSEEDVTPDAAKGYDDLVRRLYSMGGSENAPVHFTLSSNAKRLWVDYSNRNGEHTARLPEGPAQWLSAKGQMHSARLALVIHAARLAANEEGSEDISEESMRRGILLSDWLMNETARVYEAIGVLEAAAAANDRVLASLPERFTVKEFDVAASFLRHSSRALRKRRQHLVETGTIIEEGKGHFRKRPTTA
jgi:hypothetical protein